jgi:hypothetical protein
MNAFGQNWPRPIRKVVAWIARWETILTLAVILSNGIVAVLDHLGKVDMLPSSLWILFAFFVPSVVLVFACGFIVDGWKDADRRRRRKREHERLLEEARRS